MYIRSSMALPLIICCLNMPSPYSTTFIVYSKYTKFRIVISIITRIIHIIGFDHYISILIWIKLPINTILLLFFLLVYLGNWFWECCMKYCTKVRINIFVAVLKNINSARGVGMFNNIMFTYEYVNLHVFSWQLLGKLLWLELREITRASKIMAFSEIRL